MKFFLMNYLLFWACIIFEAQAVGIWTDSSCQAYPVAQAVQEAKKLAFLGWQRSDVGDDDDNQVAIFNALWAKSDPSYSPSPLMIPCRSQGVQLLTNTDHQVKI